jgi:flavin-dependent dehydrogenase
MQSGQNCEILIVGAGPAGLSTALHLARLAPELTGRILVLEKTRHPRPKLCGGALVVDAEVILRRLGLDVREIPHVDARAAHFDFAGRGLTLRQWRGRTLRLVQRDEFDAWLAQKAREAGIAIRENDPVRSLQAGPDGVTVETESGILHARVVVGADGANGVVRACILPQARRTTARLLEVLVPPNEACRHHTQEAYFDFRPVPSGIAGYVWDFPARVQGQPMRSWGIYDANLFSSEDRPPLKRVLAEEMARHGYTLEGTELKAHPIRWFEPYHRLSVPRVLLVGDAAGADAVFGEGISFALGSGRLAAIAIRQAFRKNDFSFRGYLARIWFSPLGQALVLRWFLAYILYSLRWRWFQWLLWRVMKPLVALVAQTLVIHWAWRAGATGSGSVSGNRGSSTRVPEDT